jgi:ectoine hydroxylase-related dioxygenase (phytanoyl-CoA dioxygenase family)
MPKTVTAEQVAHYREHGWVKVPGVFDGDEIATAVEHVEAFLDSGARELRGRDINHVDGTVNSNHRLQNDEWINSVLNSEEMKSFVRPFLDDEPIPRKCELFAKPAVVGLPSPAHQDNYLFCIKGGNALTVWVALDPAGEENGALYYHDSSHRAGVVAHEKSFAPGTSQRVADQVDLSKYPIVMPSLEPGDVLVHHSEIVHGSQANTSERSRRGWTLQYKAASAEYDQVRIAQYEKDLAEQLAARGQEE